MKTKHKTNILAVVTQKGGAGKTTTAVNLAASFAEKGERTLLIDMDYQANATSWLGKKEEAITQNKCVSRVLLDKTDSYFKYGELIMNTRIANLDILAGDSNLQRVPSEMLSKSGNEFLLSDYMKALKSEIFDKYKYIVIDTHPSIDLLLFNALQAANYYLIPMQAEADAFDGLEYMFDCVRSLKKRNTQLFCLGVVITSYSGKGVHKELLPIIQKFLKEKKMKIKGIVPWSSVPARASHDRITFAESTNPNWRKVRDAYDELASALSKELIGTRHGQPQNVPDFGTVPRIIQSPTVSGIGLELN